MKKLFCILSFTIFSLLSISSAKAQIVTINFDELKYSGNVSSTGINALQVLGSSATMELNVNTGVAVVSGQGIDVNTNQVWNVTATYGFASYMSSDLNFSMASYTDVYDALINDPAEGQIVFSDFATVLISSPDGSETYSLFGEADPNGYFAVLKESQSYHKFESRQVPSGCQLGASAQNDFCEISQLVLYDTNDNPNAVPEPATMALMGFGLAGMGYTKRRKKNQKV